MTLRFGFLGALALLATAHAAEPAPDLDGRFTLRYQPIVCVRAPCPPGMIIISSGDKAGGGYGETSATRIEADPRTAPELAAILQAFPASSFELNVEGELHLIGGEGGTTALIYARSLNAP